MLIPLLLIAFYLLAPAGLIYLSSRWSLFEKIGAVVLSFGLGIALAFSGLLPKNATVLAIQENLSGVSVILALSLLMFSINLKAAVQLGGRTLFAFMLAVISVVSVSIIGAWLMQPHLPYIDQIAGMAVGAYVGGGPNMAAIRTAINADYDLWISMNTYDLLLSSLFVLFVITLAKPIFKYLLPSFTAHLPTNSNANHAQEFEQLADESANAYRGLIHLSFLPKTLLSLCLSVGVLAAAWGLSSLFPEDIKQAALIIAVTLFGLGVSFIPRIRALPNNYPLGMYLILVFCLSAGSLADPAIISQLNLALFTYIAGLLSGALLLHWLLCRLFSIDVDTFLISISAAVMSVPFIPVIAGALNNRALLAPGFAAAIIGYILGNHLGIAVAWLLRTQLG